LDGKGFLTVLIELLIFEEDKSRANISNDFVDILFSCKVNRFAVSCQHPLFIPGQHFLLLHLLTSSDNDLHVKYYILIFHAILKAPFIHITVIAKNGFA
jgi:hypothetical protein